MRKQQVSCSLDEMTDDPGMKDMFKYLIARDVMHQQQWLAVIEELGGYTGNLPVPNSFPHKQFDFNEFNHTFFSTAIDDIAPPQGRWTSGPSLDGKGEFNVKKLRPMGEEPQLAPPIPQVYARIQQLEGGQQRVTSRSHSGSNSTESSPNKEQSQHAQHEAPS